MLDHKRAIVRIVLDHNRSDCQDSFAHKRVIFKIVLAHNRSDCLDSVGS